MNADEDGETEFLGLGYSHRSPGQVLSLVHTLARSDAFAYVVTPNVDHVVRLYREEGAAPGGALWATYREARVRLCDSRILAGLARFSGLALPVVTGSDLTADLVLRELPAGASAVVVGGNASHLDWLRERQPGVAWQQYLPPMGLRGDATAQAELIGFVEQARADYVFLAFGAPQSEQIAQAIARRGQARGVGLCIGASIEFLTGERLRAPKWVQRFALEWAFRLLTEPRRLWRRYLVEGPRIFLIWGRWHVRRMREG